MRGSTPEEIGENLLPLDPNLPMGATLALNESNEGAVTIFNKFLARQHVSVSSLSLGKGLVLNFRLSQLKNDIAYGTQSLASFLYYIGALSPQSPTQCEVVYS